MTTMELPGIPGYFAMRLARVANKRRERSANRGRALYQTIVRLVLHMAGFSALTKAAFEWNMLAGWVAVGVSCFVLSTLLTVSSNEPSPDTDPMARR